MRNPAPRPQSDREYLEYWQKTLDDQIETGTPKDKRDAIALSAELKGLRVRRHQDVTPRGRTPLELIKEAHAKLGGEVSIPLARRMGVDLVEFLNPKELADHLGENSESVH